MFGDGALGTGYPMNLSCRTGLRRLPMEPKQSSFKVDSGADGVLSRDSRMEMSYEAAGAAQQLSPMPLLSYRVREARLGFSTCK